MITKNDCYILLADLEAKGIDTEDALTQLTKDMSNIPNREVLQFINNNRELDLAKFYTKLRKSYNSKKSKLYISIMKEIEEPNEVLTTLSALLTQLLLFSKNVDDRQMFLKHSRANEISKVLNIYFNSYDLKYCYNLLRIVKADIKVLESL